MGELAGCHIVTERLVGLGLPQLAFQPEQHQELESFPQFGEKRTVLRIEAF